MAPLDLIGLMLAQAPPEEDLIGGVVFLVATVAALMVWILFLLSLQKCFQRISPECRGMSPGLVWLNLIPLFSLGWIVYTVIKLADSVVNEASFRGINVGDGGKSLGLAFSICLVLSAVPLLGACAGIVSFVLMIVYWVKVAGFSRAFEMPTIDASVFE